MSSILVLDDREADRELLATVLGYAGYRVLKAASGAEALAIARDERPSVIVTDILMPTMNGYEFVLRLRAEPQLGETPVIFCTANWVEDEIIELARQAGVSHFLPKPFTPQDAINLVAEVLGTEAKELQRPVPAVNFDQAQLRVLNDKLVEKVEQLETAGAERQRLVAALLQAHERERERIAAYLHDDCIQAVVIVGMRLDMLAADLKGSDQVETIVRLRKHVANATERLRSGLADLQPGELDDRGLASAVKANLDRAAQTGDLAFEVEDRMSREPAEATRTLLYRLAQEAVMNVRKHADASRVDVLLTEDEEEFVVRVQDDGKGFSPDEGISVRPGHLGLPAMRERVQAAGGSLKVHSAPGAGTTVEVRVPEIHGALHGVSEGSAQ
jgi:signal transduction histidine kinase